MSNIKFFFIINIYFAPCVQGFSFTMFYTWRKVYIDEIVVNLGKEQENVKMALQMNKSVILAAASRYFQATRSKIALAINKGCLKIVKDAITDEEGQLKEIMRTIENNSTIKSLKLGDKVIKKLAQEGLQLLQEYEAGENVPMWFLKDNEVNPNLEPAQRVTVAEVLIEEKQSNSQQNVVGASPSAINKQLESKSSSSSSSAPADKRPVAATPAKNVQMGVRSGKPSYVPSSPESNRTNKKIDGDKKDGTDAEESDGMEEKQQERGARGTTKAVARTPNTTTRARRNIATDDNDNEEEDEDEDADKHAEEHISKNKISKATERCNGRKRKINKQQEKEEDEPQEHSDDEEQTDEVAKVSGNEKKDPKRRAKEKSDDEK